MVCFQLKFEWLKKIMNLRFRKTLRVNFIFIPTDAFIKKTGLLKYGFYGLQLLNTSILTYKQINTLRIKISRGIKSISKRYYKIYLRIFFCISITKKPNLTRMGKGSGAVVG